MRAIVLAAGVGKRFGARTQRRPKCLIPFPDGSNLLQRYLDAFRRCGVRDVVLVVGHLRAQIRRECLAHGAGLDIRFVVNQRFRKGSVLSLATASKELRGAVLVMDADVHFEPGQLRRLLRSRMKSAFLADPRSRSAGEEMMLMSRKGRLEEISKKVRPDLKIVGEATGILKLSPADSAKLRRILSRFVRKGNVSVEYEDAYCDLLKMSRFGVVPIRGFWSEMDFEGDWKKIAKHRGGASGPRRAER